jgi:hypothetical protein
MAAVRRKGDGKIATVTTGPAAAATPAPRARPAASVPPPKPIAPATTVDRKLLLDTIEDDRREHDRLMRRAKQLRFTDEETGAASVAAYLKGLIERIEAGLSKP